MLTWDRSPLSRVLIALAAAYALVWWVLPWFWFDLRGDSASLGLPVGALRGALMIAKPTLLVLLAIDLARASSAVREGTCSARRAAIGWGLAWLAVLIPMIAFRDRIADWTDGATSRLTSHSFRGYDMFGMTEDRERHAHWMAGWAAGRFQFAELAFVPVYVTAMVVIAKTTRRWRAILVQVIGTFALGLTWIVSFDLVLITYDVYYEGILIGPLLTDLTYVIVPLRTESTLASALYLALAVTNRWILRAQR
jgi:hypothetical protein